jgi:hypothetical protein
MYIDVLAADCRIINCDVSDVLKNTFGNGIMTYGLRTLIMGGTVQDTDEESIVIQNGANDCTIIGTDTRRPGRVDNAYHIRATGTVTGLSAVNNVCRGTSSSSPSSYGYDIGPSVTSYLVDLPACQYVTNPSNIAANINSYFAPAGLTGATAISRYVGATTSGAPTTGSFAKGDYIIAQSGAIWICTSTGTPGSWTQVGGSSTTLGATTVLTASNATWSVPSGATVLKITAVGGGGGGGGGGAASSGIAQTGGSGGSAGVWVTRIVNIGDVTLLAITIGSGGSAGSAGASGGGAGGNGVAGGTTTITNANGTTAISVKGNPGGRGTGSGASSTTNVISAAYGGSTPPTVAFGLAGSGGQSGTVGGAPNGFSGSGGGGGGTASATLGGSGGSGGSGDTAGAAGTTAGSGTSAGTAGTAGATNTGSGGGGGGGGTAGSGAGGIGGIGGTGIVIIEVVG